MKNQYKGSYIYDGQNRYPSVLALTEKSSTIDMSRVLKGGKALATENDGYARISARRLTWSHSGGQIKPLHFAGMDSARVIATGGLGTPDSETTSIFHGQHSAIASINRIDVVPTDLNHRQGIMNSHAFIKDFKVWPIEHEIESNCQSANNHQGCNRSVKSATHDAFGSDTDQEDTSHNECGNALLGSVTGAVVHGLVQSHREGACNV